MRSYPESWSLMSEKPSRTRHWKHSEVRAQCCQVYCDAGKQQLVCDNLSEYLAVSVVGLKESLSGRSGLSSCPERVLSVIPCITGICSIGLHWMDS